MLAWMDQMAGHLDEAYDGARLDEGSYSSRLVAEVTQTPSPARISTLTF